MKNMMPLSLNREIPTTEESTSAVRFIGIKALMLALLEDAIQCLRSPKDLVRTQAVIWMTSKERRYVFSFAVVCQVLELEPSAVRRSVMGLVPGSQTPGGVRRRSRPNSRRLGALQLKRDRRQRLLPRVAHEAIPSPYAPRMAMSPGT